MKKVKIIVLGILIFYAVTVFLGAPFVFSYPVMLARTLIEVGVVDSHSKVTSGNRVAQIAYADGKVVCMEFERSSRFSPIWLESAYQIYTPDDEEIIELRHSSYENNTILWGYCKDSQIKSVQVELINGELIVTDTNEEGLFAMAFEGSPMDIQTIFGVDQEGTTVAQRNR